MNSSKSNVWSSGLWGCFSDLSTCCLTMWCPCITFGRIAEIVDEGRTSCCANGTFYVLLGCVTGCSSLYSCFFRSKLRHRYSLEASPCNDCLVHFFCEHCSLCQEYRELQSRGFDMSAGWKGNMGRQTRGVELAPVVEGGMKR